VRIVLRLSTLAKAAAGTAALGVVIALYGELKGVDPAVRWGRVLLIAGFLVYIIERARMLMRQRRVPRDDD